MFRILFPPPLFLLARSSPPFLFVHHGAPIFAPQPPPFLGPLPPGCPRGLSQVGWPPFSFLFFHLLTLPESFRLSLFSPAPFRTVFTHFQNVPCFSFFFSPFSPLYLSLYCSLYKFSDIEGSSPLSLRCSFFLFFFRGFTPPPPPSPRHPPPPPPKFGISYSVSLLHRFSGPVNFISFVSGHSRAFPPQSTKSNFVPFSL